MVNPARLVPRLLALLVPAALAVSGAGGLPDAPRGASPDDAPAARARAIRVHRIEGMIHGVTAAILERAIERSAKVDDRLFVLELDTPGGLVTSTEDMVRAILNSPVPVAVWVGPRGAHAASAGFFLLIAADVAAMAPVTRTGASSVITLGGESKEGDVALKKASADLQALLRSAARLRGRPPELAEEAVRDARSWSAEEALDAKLIDLVVPSREALIEALDGREVVRPDGTRVTLALAGAPVVVHGMRWSENARNVVLHPTVLALLLSIAVLGIYVELTHPGLILPGAVGVIGLAVFLYGSSILPVRGFAALMLILGVLAFILEIKVTSYGLLGAAGTVLVALGLYLLFPRDIPGLAVPLMTLVPLVLVLVAALAAVTVLVARAHRAPVTTGREGLVGEEGESASTLDPEGTVLVHGEVWRARSPRPLPAGARVRVTGSRGLLLFVEPSGVPGGSASGVPDGSGSGVPDGSASGVSIGSASGVPDGSAVGPPVERRNG